MENKGLTFVEMLIAITIIAVVSVSILQLNYFMSRHSVRANEKIFATQKAIQMMEELRSLVSGSEQTEIVILDNYDDGTLYETVLTTDKDTTDPAAPLSGNKSFGGEWKYLRRIEVLKVPEEPFARKVFVRVYKNSMSNPGTSEATLAETASILRTIVGNYVPTQVYDVYVIAIENIPGWWVSLSELRPTFANVLEDLEVRNPGIEFREHWITRLSYGRDPYYNPYINESTQANNLIFPYVYFYPGLTRDDNGHDFFYYTPEHMNARFNIDGTLQNTDGYTLCDMYNHSIRYPEEESLYARQVVQAQLDGTTEPEYSLRMLIEKMNSDPTSLKNILLINLHGELVPLPPMRNYTDAAKEPSLYENVRIVTHPENLEYSTGAEVKLRVYPYVTDPNNVSVVTAATGFKARYFNWSSLTNPPDIDLTLDTPDLTRVDSTVNFNWAAGSPDATINADSFSVMWTSTITAQYSETYTFYTETDDGVRLFINDVSVFTPTDAGWQDQGTTEYTGNVFLTAGQQYELRMEFYENTGTANAVLYWSSNPSLPKEVISGCDPHMIASPAAGVWPSTATIPATSIYLPYDDIDTADITIQRINGNPGEPYWIETLAEPSTNYVVTHPNTTDTLITLYNLPLLHGENSSGQGLPSSDQLYGYEYIPCPIGTTASNPGTEFSDFDLTNSNNRPKNTARAIITFAAGSISDGRLTFETRIGNDTATGSAYQLSNLSRSYVWIGNTPPATEQYQFMGDCRHCPYLDVKENEGYNWYFRNVNDTDYPGFSMAVDGWRDNDDGWGRTYIDLDLPRVFMTIREGLLKTQGIWSTMNGVSFFYHGIGGEMGGNKPPLRNGITTKKLPWSTGNETNEVDVDEILNHLLDIRGSRCIAQKDDTWFAKYWLGELYPDTHFSTWSATGNLPTGLTSDEFYRAKYSTTLDSDFTYERGKCISFQGSASFVNGGIFRHGSDGSATGNLTVLGSNMANMFNFPLLTSISAPRPFYLSGGSDPPGYNETFYSNLRTSIEVPDISGTDRIYYESSKGGSYDANSVVRVTRDTNTCYMVFSGIATQDNFGPSQMGKLVLITMIRTFLDSGLYSDQNMIAQVPLVDITNPTVADEFNNPSSIKVKWNHSWTKWDGESYTDEYPSDFEDTSTTVVYSVKYSPDSERSWLYCQDNSTTSEGEKNASYCITGTEYNWNVSSLPAGSYVVLIECYRQDIDLHYSYEKMRIHIRR